MINLFAISHAAVLLFLVCASSLAADSHVVDTDKRPTEAYRQRTDTVRLRYLAEDEILLIRVPSLYGGLTRDLGNALREFFSSDRTPLNGLILDLRDNRGGVLFESVGVISVLMSPNILVARIEGSTEDTTFTIWTGRKYYQRDAAEADFLGGLPTSLKDTPLAVVVNGGTASGAEIIAAALQEHRRGVIIGNRTGGITSIASDAATHVQWRSAHGRLLNNVGITPDIEVADQEKYNSDEHDTYLAAARGYLRGR